MPELERITTEIAREIARVHLDSYGQPVSNVEVAVQESFVVVVMEVALSPAEKTLLAAGEGEAVRATREAFQSAIASTFRAIVERSTGRSVASFASRTVPDGEPPWSAEVFRLG